MCLILFPFVFIEGQQLSSWSSYYETGFIWNPALTAKWNTGEFIATHRQDWLGFDGAPEYSNFSFQLPFIAGYNTKSAIGVFFERDKVGPLEKLGGAFTYNYRFYPRFFGNKDDVFSIGFMVKIGRYQFNIANVVAFDPDRLLINVGEPTSLISPNSGIGFFYNTASDFYAHQKSHYYVGLSLNQLVPSNIVQFTGRSDNLSLARIQSGFHATIHGGYRYIPFRSGHFFEPNLMIIYGLERGIHAMVNLRYELINVFWLAGGIATTGEVFSQLGVVFDNNSILGNMVKNGSLRLGIKTSYQLGKVKVFGAMGFEFYGAYLFELE